MAFPAGRRPGTPLDPADPSIVATRYWHRLEDGRIQRDVCPRLCKLDEGQWGMGFVRARRPGRDAPARFSRAVLRSPAVS